MSSPQPIGALSDLVTRYGAIALGLAIGTAAKYGVGLNDGETPTWRGFAADVLMLGMLGLIAVIAADVLSLASLNAKVFVGAVAALLSARLIKMVREAGAARAAAELQRLGAVARAADLVQVPAGLGLPDAVHAQVVPEGNAAGTGARLLTIYGGTAAAPIPPDQQDHLDHLL